MFENTLTMCIGIVKMTIVNMPMVHPINITVI